MQRDNKSDINTALIGNTIRNIAAEHVLPRFNALKRHEIEAKTGPQDLVTSADIACEEALTAFFKTEYPESFVLGEEAHGRGQASYDALSSRAGMVWVIDPVDGTFNFVNARKEFGVIVACVVDGVTRHGWIYDVLTGSMAYAGQGEGAYINNEPIRSSETGQLSGARGYINRKYLPGYSNEYYERCLKESAGIYSLRCTAHEYMALACGDMEFAIYGKSKPWDHLAGALLLSEAGGTVTCWDGEAYRPQHVQSGLLAAANNKLGDELREIIINPMLEAGKRRKSS